MRVVGRFRDDAAAGSYVDLLDLRLERLRFADDLRDEPFRDEPFRDEDLRDDDLRDALLRDDDLREALLRDDFFRDDDFFAGTLPPSRRASDKPIAIACLRLFTFLPDRPLLSVPCLRSCIAFSTFDCAFLPYRAMMRLLVWTGGRSHGLGLRVEIGACRERNCSVAVEPSARLPGPCAYH